MATPAAPDPDYTTLLAHLRSIHLSFVLAAAAIFTALSTSDTIYETALDQLNDVVTLTDALDDDAMVAAVGAVAAPGGRSEPLEDFVTSAVEEYFEVLNLAPGGIATAYVIEDMPRENYGYLGGIDEIQAYEDRMSWLRKHGALLGDGTAIRTSPRLLYETRPRMLVDHADRLNLLMAYDRLFHSPTFDGPYFHDGTPLSERYPGPQGAERDRLRTDAPLTLSIALTGVELTGADSRAVFANSQGHVQEDPVGYEDYDFRFDELRLRIRVTGKGAEPLRFKMTLPVMFRTASLGFVDGALRDTRLDDTYLARYLAGARSFDRLFPELARVSRHLGSLSPSELEVYLQDFKQKSGAPVSVLGLEVSRDLIEIWGVLLMLSIQLYFCLHYSAFLGRLRPGADLSFPWIGVYRGWLPSLVFQLSTALPLATTLFTIFWNRGPGHVTASEVALVLIAVALFVWAAWTWHRVRVITTPPGDQRSA